MAKRVLVVEDCLDLRKLLGVALASRGWEAILAEGGRETLAKLVCETPSVILMDMGLPDMNGFDLAAALKRHPVYRSIPILGTTGYPGSIARERCLAAGCDDFISKPFAIAELQSRLSRLVSGKTPDQSRSYQPGNAV